MRTPRAGWFLGCVAMVALVMLAGQAEAARVRHYNWTVDYLFWSPDCVEKVIIGINGEYPGPTVQARAGDTVVVKLKNALPTEGVVIHWHGIRQIGTPWNDGTSFVSQCPINSGETYTYKFKVDRPGTYFYHGHFGMQRTAGFYGSLIVDVARGQHEPFKYDGEFNIKLNDWYHKSIYEQQAALYSVPFRWVGEPQSLLLEGRGSYDCSRVPTAGDCLTCNSSRPQCSPYVMTVEPGKTYRLRLASVATLSALNFILEGHNMTVVEADSHYVEPFVVDNLDLYSGQSYSVLFTANQDSSRNYWAGVNVRGRKPNTTTGLAILNYSPNSASKLPTSPTPVSPVWNNTAVSLAQAEKYMVKKGYGEPIPKKADRTLILLNTQNKLAGKTKWAVNNITYVPTSTPLLAALKYNLTKAYDTTPPPDTIPYYNYSAPPSYPETNAGSGVYIFNYGQVVDVVLQNAATLTEGNSEIHPWHLHGHDFWVLGYGHGRYEPATDPQTFNLVNPPLRNTVAVFPFGWVAIRYIANNPGAWPFHCHIEPHFHMGMGVMFAEGLARLPPVPSEALGCGLTKQHR